MERLKKKISVQFDVSPRLRNRVHGLVLENVEKNIGTDYKTQKSWGHLGHTDG